MTREEKEAFVRDLRERLSGTPVVYLTDFTGLDVQAMTELRRRLKENGAEYLVVKNRLALMAIEDVDIPDIAEYFRGPTGLVLGHEGPVDAAKVIAEFADDHDERPSVKVGVVDREVVSPEMIQRLAELPNREQLLAQMLGALQAPMAQLAMALEGKMQEFAGLVDALREERESAG